MLRTLEEQVDPKHAAVLVVDVQRDFCCADGALARRGKDMSLIQQMMPNLVQFVKQARQANVPLVFIRMMNNDWTQSPAWLTRLGFGGKVEYPVACVENSPGLEFYELFPEPGDGVVTKYRYSAFIGTNLDLMLRSRGIKTVIMTGIATNVCVESTARDAFMNDYYVVFLDDCTAATSLEEHQGALYNIANFFGRVCSSKEVVDAWQSTRGAK